MARGATFAAHFSPKYLHEKMSVTEKLAALRQAKATENLAAGQAFLAENAQREGVISLGNGLQYEILTEGSGPKPGPTSSVTCHYHGTLPNGTVFDSSVLRGRPATFPLNRVISGWTEALQLMGVGSKWRLFLPPHLAYGDQHVSVEIGPNSTLIFEVELLGIG